MICYLNHKFSPTDVCFFFVSVCGCLRTSNWHGHCDAAVRAVKERGRYKSDHVWCVWSLLLLPDFEVNRRDEVQSVSVGSVSGCSHGRAAEYCREASRALNKPSMEWSWFCIVLCLTLVREVAVICHYNM